MMAHLLLLCVASTMGMTCHTLGTYPDNSACVRALGNARFAQPQATNTQSIYVDHTTVLTCSPKQHPK